MVTDFVREEIAQPLGVDAFYIGIPDEVLPRISSAYEPPSSTRPKTEGNVPDLLDRANGLEVWRSVFRGITNARSLARIYAMLGNDGELDGVRILSPGRVAIATELQTDDYDQTQKRAFPKGLGFRLQEGVTPASFGHTGGGGSLGFADPAARFSFGYAKNMHAGARLNDARVEEGTALMGGKLPARGLMPAHYVAFKVQEALGLL
jgi:CubicO group peptidase (beta-lactamase class C family)